MTSGRFAVSIPRAGAVAVLPVSRLFTLAFILLVVLHPVLIWAFPYFPSQDGPIHLGITRTLADYDHPAYPAMAEYFEREWSLQRNPLTYLVLGGLSRVMPLLTAEKVYLTVIVTLFPLSLLYALRGMTRDPVLPAFFAFPMTYGYTLMAGFYSFALGVSAFLLTVGLWLRLREHWTARRVAAFAAAAFATYVCHIFAAFNVLLFVGLATLWEIAMPVLRRRGRFAFAEVRELVLARGIPPLIAVSPVLAIVLAFMITVDAGSIPAMEISLPYRIVNFVALAPMVHYDGPDMLVAIPTSVLALVSLIDVVRMKRRGEASGDDMFLFVFASYFALLLFVPTGASGSIYIYPRLMVFVFLALIVALAASPLGLANRRFAASVLIAVSLANLGYRYGKHGEANDYLAEYLSGARLIAPNSTVLALTVDSETGARAVSETVLPFLHAAGHIVVDRHVVDLKNFQAAHGDFFPVYYRPSLNPYVQLSPHLEAAPPPDVRLDYPAGVAGRVDYVLLWGALDRVRHRPEVRALTAQLDRDFVLIDISEKRRLMRLYRRKSPAGQPSGNDARNTGSRP